MTPDPIDISFAFPHAQGHFACICSRCLKRITPDEIAFRVLRPNRLVAFEEYRYCEPCQTSAGFLPQQSKDEVLARLTATMREDPRFRVTKTEIDNMLKAVRMTRIAKARAEAKAKERQVIALEDPEIMALFGDALRCGRAEGGNHVCSHKVAGARATTVKTGATTFPRATPLPRSEGRKSASEQETYKDIPRPRTATICEGSPCKKCGSTTRYIAYRQCVACSSAYARTEKAKATASAYKRTEKSKATSYAYHQSDRGKALVAAWKQSEVGRASLQVKECNRRAKQAHVGESITSEEWIEIKHNYLNCCFRCHKHESECEGGILKPDHIKPLRPSNLLGDTPGTNTIDNIQPLCWPCWRERADQIRISRTSRSEFMRNPSSDGGKGLND